MRSLATLMPNMNTIKSHSSLPSTVAAWLLPSVVAVVCSAALVGLLDGYLSTGEPLQTVAAAGFLSFLLVPAGLALALLVRGLWWAWRPHQIVAALTEDTGGAPRLAAWSLYLLLASWAMAGAAFNSVRLLMSTSPSGNVIALGTAIAITAVAIGLVIGSRPGIDLGAALLRRIDRAVHRWRGRGAFTPRVVAIATGASAAALLAGAWRVSILPRIGHLDIDFLYYLMLFGVIVVALHWLWARARRAATAAMAGVAAIVAVAVLATALYVRYYRPYSMIAVWADADLVGSAIDIMYDVRSLRSTVRLREFRPAEQPGAAHPDVVLITIDTVRADRTAMYGGPDTMPSLAALAQEGTVFEWAFAPSNVTRRSLPAIATGLHPTRIKGRVAGWALRIDPRHVLLAERFRAAGYDTAGFFCCTSQFGPEHRLGLIRGIEHLEIEKKGAALADMARRWLSERDAGQPRAPLFLWLHFIEPHLWQEDYPAKQHGSKPSVRYDKSLTATDRFLGTLLSGVWAGERKQRTIIAITSDHGEALGDHGHLTHSTSLYNAEIRVPLVIAGPGVKRQRIKQPVSAVQMAPTLLDLAGFVPPRHPQMDSESLGPLLRGQASDDLDAGEVYAVMVKDRSIKRNVRALVKGRYKYIEEDGTDLVELYDIIADPDEKKNLSKEQPDIVQRLRQRLAELRFTLAEPLF
jgi:arylsulfatase A-like enzyme